MEETWKPIKEFVDYEVSNKGKIRRIIDKKYKKQTPNKKGYKRVFFFIGGKTYTRYVHRLVAQTFLLNIENKKTVNHKDGDKSNNCIDNLEWATYKEQNEHAIRLGLIKTGKESPMFGRKASDKTKEKMKISQNKIKHIRSKKINQYDLEGNFIKKWSSINDAIRFYNNKAIEFCCVGKRKTASGYVWKFEKGGK